MNDRVRIDGAPERFTVDRDGNIYNGDKLVKGYSAGCGYNKVTLGKLKDYRHRIVARAFVPNPNGYPEVDHIDGDKGNCRAANLEWCTRMVNVMRSYTRKPLPRTRIYRRPVTYSRDETIIAYPSIAAGARDRGCSTSAIRQSIFLGGKCAGGVWRDAT